MSAVTLENRRILEEPRDRWETIPVAEVDRLEVVARLPLSVRLADLEAVRSYLQGVRESVANRDRNRLAELVADHAGMLDLLKQLLQPMPATPAAQAYTELSHLLAGSSADVILAWPAGITEKARRLLEQMERHVSDRFEELGRPEAAMKKAASELQALNESIDGISVMFQTGEDRKAMDFIIRLSDVSQKILRILAQMELQGAVSLDSTAIDSNPSREFFEGLNAALRELLEAFNSQDTVLIADLLEYEVGPRFEQLAEFIGGLSKDGA
jgi:hypothetical protein